MPLRNFLLICAAAACLQACTHLNTLPAGVRYVNMGSSFAAGSSTGPAQPGSPARCFRSTANYATLLAAHLHLALEDVSCAGATSAHLLGAWNELPAQIDSVTAATRLVTITVGGNDIAFAGNLTAASCEPGETIRVAGRVLPCPPPLPVSEDAYIKLEQNLREIARQVSVRAPQARAVFIQYVTMVPPRQCPQSRFAETEAAELRVVAARLADITARAARQSGALVLLIDKTSRDHTPCDRDPWSVGLPRDYDETLGAPWHPNRQCMAAIAEALAALLGR